MKRAAWVVIILVVVALLIDVYLIIDGGTQESLSYQIIEWSYNYPAFTFLTGFTMGHLFWVLSDKRKP